MDRCRDSATAVNERVTGELVHRHDRRIAEQSAKFYRIAHPFSDNRNQARRSRLLVDHAKRHLIGNHTSYHVDVNSLPLKEACAEIQDTSSAITAITGQQVEYVRPPYGSWNKELECEVLMIPVFWTLDTLDWKVKNADQIVREVLSDVEENDVILMHDSYRTTVDAALRIVDALQEKGYEFVTADELILE